MSHPAEHSRIFNSVRGRVFDAQRARENERDETRRRNIKQKKQTTTMLSEREILSLVEPLLPNDVGIKFVVSTTNPKRLCLEGIGAARRRTNGEEEDSGDDESKESDDEEHHEIERGDALLDVEIIAGEERGRDVKIAITKLCDGNDGRQPKLATPSEFEKAISRAKQKKNNNNRIRMPLACLETRCKRALFIVYAHRAHTLRTCAQFSPSVFGDPASRRSLIARQLVEGMDYVHEKGLCMHGRVGLENFVIDEDKAKESIEKNVESTMTPLIEIGVLARATQQSNYIDTDMQHREQRRTR